jgi:hypothetical protein
MGCDYLEELGSAGFVLTHALSAVCFRHTDDSAVGLTGTLEDKAPSGEGWAGLTKPTLSISALLMRLIAVGGGCKKVVRPTISRSRQRPT